MGTTNFAARNDSRAHARACPDMLIHAHEGKKIWNRQKETPEGVFFLQAGINQSKLQNLRKK